MPTADQRSSSSGGNPRTTSAPGDQPAYVAVDIGTSSVKAAVVTLDGRLLAYRRQGLVPTTLERDDWHAGRWFTAVASTLSSIPAATLRLARAVSISGNGPTLVPIDSQGNESAPTLLWIDDRRVVVPGCESYYLSKINWFRAQRADDFARTARFVSCPEFVAYRLTGELVTSIPDPRYLPYYWDDRQLDAYRIDNDLLPQQRSNTEIVGAVRRAVVGQVGPIEGLPVFVGGPDFLMSLVGTGVVRDGLTCDRAGTSEGVNRCLATGESADGLRVLPHVVPGCWNAAAIFSSSGRMFEWYRRLAGLDSLDYGAMVRRLLQTPTANGPWFYPAPHVSPTYTFSDGRLVGLQPHHGRWEVGRAVVDANAFAVREAISAFRRAHLPISAMRLSGGQARNAYWNQYKADVCGVPLELPAIIDGELAGGACVAAAGLGDAPTIVDAADRIVRVVHRYLPNPAVVDELTDRYNRYRRVRDRYRPSPSADEASADETSADETSVDRSSL